MKKDCLHWLILTGVPFENSGGAQRAAQMARELVALGDKVTYVYALNYKEKNSDNIQKPKANFDSFYVNQFNIYSFIKNMKKHSKLIVLVEVPHHKFLPIIQVLKDIAFKTIYELIDPWDTELGQNWYKKNIEYRIINLANILTATAASLQQQLSQKTNRKVHLIPNAYDDNLFDGSKYERPKDLPHGTTIGYIGALWGSWFDIDLVVQVAKNYPNYNIVLIGEYLNQFNYIVPSNIYFLNLKPQNELPSYLCHFNIGLIPFKTNKLTDGVNPLKVYEYLAMGLPVVSTNLPELSNIPNVFIGYDKQDFIEKIDLAMNNHTITEESKNWLNKNTWKSRISDLLEIIYSK